MSNALNTTVNIDTVIGPICNAHPNVCLYVNNIIGHGPNEQENMSAIIFRDYEFPSVCKKWCDMPTEVIKTDLSDTYWILKCWIELSQYYNEKFSVGNNLGSGYINNMNDCCNNLVNDIPRIIMNSNEMFDIVMTEYTIMSVKLLMNRFISVINDSHNS